jgi:uncharacterized integral membrane protein (TIGR00697 family)
LVTLCTLVAVYLPASALWDANTNHGAAAYQLVFKNSSRMFLASMIAYFFGEFLNSTVLAKLKIATQGRHLFLRVISSTTLGVAVDTIIFCNLAFWNILPDAIIWKMILTLYVFKVSYEIIALPVTYWLIAYLKKADNINYFDSKTRFNPFSLNLRD